MRRREKSVVRRHFPYDFPDPFDRVVFWGVGRQAIQSNDAPMPSEPFFTLIIQIMAGPIVENEKDFAPLMLANYVLQEL